MLRKFLCLFALLSICPALLAQRTTDSTTVAVSGTPIKIGNQYGGMNGSFEEIIAGSPATVSIPIQGCKSAGTCDTLETNTSTTAAQIRTPSISKPYDYFLVTPSWTGGTNVSVQVNTTITTAKGGGSGAAPGSDGYLVYSCSGMYCGFPDGTAHQLLHGGRTFGPVDLTQEVSNALPPANVDPAVLAAVDNSIQSSAVDANGAPSFLTTASSTLAIPINGGTTPLAMFIGGKQMKLTTNVTKTLVSGLNFIFAVGETTNAASLVAGDFVSSTIPMSYSYSAPSCSNGSNVSNGVGGNFAAASSSNPHYWFNMSTNQMNICTSSGGAFSATSYGGANSPAILIGVAWSGGTNVDAIAPMPFAASPIAITRYFGPGSDGALQITSAGTTTKDGLFQTTGFSVITGTLTESTYNTGGVGQTPGLLVRSQNPVIIYNGSLTATGKGRTASAGGTGVGANGGSGGYGGAGGGGGGATANAGGTGGGRLGWLNTSTVNVAAAGTTSPTAGAAGANAVGGLSANPPLLWPYFPNCSGGTGGSGGGDGSNNAGTGGAAGSLVMLNAPTVSVSGTGSITADGSAGSNSAGGNSAGAGGGGGGCALVSTFMPVGITIGSNLTANGGSAGTKTGTGANGGTGGAGIAQIVRLQ